MATTSQQAAQTSSRTASPEPAEIESNAQDGDLPAPDADEESDGEEQLSSESEQGNPAGLSTAQVDEALQSFSEMGSFLDLSDGARATDRDTETAARCKVWTSLEEALKKRSYVYRLDLSRQRLKTLPAEIGKLNKVEFCTLRENDLTDLSLPEEFFDLYRLKELDLSYNRFRTLPACICTLIELEKIDISGCCNDFADAKEGLYCY